MEVTVREALNRALEEELNRDGRVFIMGEEVAEYDGAYKITQGLLAKFGAQRIIDTPITEHGFAGIGVGAAMGGIRPIVEFMTFNFSMQAIDQIVNSAAKTHYMSGGDIAIPIVFRGPNGAAARVAAQHSQCFASWYASVPGLKVVSPYTAIDHKLMLKAAIRDDNPVIFLENEVLYGHKHHVDEETYNDVDICGEFGKAKMLRSGNDVTLISFSLQLKNCLEAADRLEKEGIQCDVIDLISLRPLDIDTILKSVRKTNRVVCVQESWGYCGFMAEVASQIQYLAFDHLDAPVTRVSGVDVPTPYAANLEKLAFPSVDSIYSAVQEVCYRK